MATRYRRARRLRRRPPFRRACARGARVGPLPRSGARFPAPGEPPRRAPAGPPERAAATKAATNSPRGSAMSSARKGRPVVLRISRVQEIDFDLAVFIDRAQRAAAKFRTAAGEQPCLRTVLELQRGGDLIAHRLLTERPRARACATRPGTKRCTRSRSWIMRSSTTLTSVPRPVHGPVRTQSMASGASGKSSRPVRAKTNVPDGRR